MPNLDIKAEVGAIQNKYKTDPKQSSFNALVLGESGHGKTYLARTCRFPIHIDSFDPGGSKGLQKWIDEGKVVVDSRWESEDPLRPSQYALWKAEFKRRVEGNYFDHFGTYMLDSSTTWSEAIMNDILKRAGIAGQAPRFTHDYTPQKIEIRNMLRVALDLPCDFILTGHLKIIEDPGSGRCFRFNTTGAGMTTIPLLFDEQYTLLTKASSQGVKYQLLTQPTGMYPARSRLAGNGKLELYEEPNIKSILTKCNMSIEDKECF